MFNGVNGKNVKEIFNETILEILRFRWKFLNFEKINKSYLKFKGLTNSIIYL